ncbi:MAG: hypothetical protein BIFFINMI_03055 [Phycisphaerae bacterium]|nr:hypothetical protein [Phycisphaerae bacterium]
MTILAAADAFLTRGFLLTFSHMKRLADILWLWRRSGRPISSVDDGLADGRAWLSAVGAGVPLVVDGRAWINPALPRLAADATGEQTAAAIKALAGAASAPPTLLKMLSRARADLKVSAPLLVALDNPWLLARATLNDQLRAAGKDHGDALASAVKLLADRLPAAAAALAAADVDGVVLCVGDAQWSRAMRAAGYDDVLGACDAACLSAVRAAGKLAVVQIEGMPEDFARFARYECDALAWADREHPPSLAYARDRVGAGLIGGLSADAVAGGDGAKVKAQGDDARRQARDHALVVGVGRPMDAAPQAPVRI